MAVTLHIYDIQNNVYYITSPFNSHPSSSSSSSSSSSPSPHSCLLSSFSLLSPSSSTFSFFSLLFSFFILLLLLLSCHSLFLLPLHLPPFKVFDALERVHQCATVQVQNPRSKIHLTDIHLSDHIMSPSFCLYLY